MVSVVESSIGFGAAVLFHGNDKHAPRLRHAGTFLGEQGQAISIMLPDNPESYVAKLFLGAYVICTVRDDPRLGRQYVFSDNVVFEQNKDLSLLIAQISALVHEAIETKATHNPHDYAGIVPLGVQ